MSVETEKKSSFYERRVQSPLFNRKKRSVSFANVITSLGSFDDLVPMSGALSQ